MFGLESESEIGSGLQSGWQSDWQSGWQSGFRSGWDAADGVVAGEEHQRNMKKSKNIQKIKKFPKNKKPPEAPSKFLKFHAPRAWEAAEGSPPERKIKENSENIKKYSKNIKRYSEKNQIA